MTAMIPSDAELARLQLAAYEYPDASGKVTPFAWDWKTTLNGEPAGFKIVDGCTVVIIPGTRTLGQWRLDFMALPETTSDADLGRIDAGFFAGCEDFVEAFAGAPARSGPHLLIGHSRGAAQAPLIAGLLEAHLCDVSRLVLFAPPRAGMARLADCLARVDKALYRNAGPDGHDYVTDVPFALPGLTPYCQIGPLTDIHAEPLPNDDWGLFRFHHMELYAAGVAAAEGGK